LFTAAWWRLQFILNFQVNPLDLFQHFSQLQPARGAGNMRAMDYCACNPSARLAEPKALVFPSHSGKGHGLLRAVVIKLPLMVGKLPDLGKRLDAAARF